MTHNIESETPIRVTHVSEFKRDRDITVGIRTGILNAFLTGYGKSIGVLFPNEKVEVKEIDVQGEASVVSGEIQKQEMQ